MSSTLRLSLVLMLLAGGLAACGKRGQLEPPPSQQQASTQGGPDAKAGETAAPTKLGKKRVPITAPKRDLLIDAILD